MSQHTTRETRSGYATYGLGHVPTGATTGRAGLGFDSSNQPQLLDDAGNVLLTASTNTVTFAASMAHTGLINQGTANNVLTATGTVIANAAAVTTNVGWVYGADDAKGVIFPSGIGNMICVYNNHATAGLKIYPPVNGTLDGGSANAALVQEGNTISFYISVADGTYRKMNAFTANT